MVDSDHRRSVYQNTGAGTIDTIVSQASTNMFKPTPTFLWVVRYTDAHSWKGQGGNNFYEWSFIFTTLDTRRTGLISKKEES